jgi:hypothetical protein
MKSKLARVLRKWADLIDPRVKPTNAITLRIDVDARDAVKAVGLVEQAAKRVLADSIIEDWLGNRRLRRPDVFVRTAFTGQVQRQEWPK